MTNTPNFVGVDILITSPSGLLRHILSSTIVSFGIPDFHLSSSTVVVVRGPFISWSRDTNHYLPGPLIESCIK